MKDQQHHAGASKMTVAGLRPAAELAEKHPHGTRIRYIGGCKCTPCRSANTNYEKHRAAARKAGDWNGLVPTARARAHAALLSSKGVGYKQVADAAGIAPSIMAKIVSGKRAHIRARSERSILAVTVEAAADHALTDAAPMWKQLKALLASGYSAATLARELGYKSRALQFRTKQCTVRSAHEVGRLFERLRRVPAKASSQLLENLRAEGYRPTRVLAIGAALAESRGKPLPDFNVYRGFISAHAADLIREIHEQLTAEVPA